MLFDTSTLLDTVNSVVETQGERVWLFKKYQDRKGHLCLFQIRIPITCRICYS